MKSPDKLLYKMLHLFKVSLFLLIIVSVLPSADAKICFEIDARNDPKDIEQKLRNCTIVVGSVSILLIERHRDVFDFNKLHFPELQEITGFLLLFRVHGIKTFRYMFPNLKVIRGEKLKGHYALIVYDVNSMVEIGLPSLIKIQQGYVMVSRCPLLCYFDTIDWNRLTEKPQTISGTYGETLEIGNHLPSETPAICPSKKSCPKSCENCWNYRQCQLTDTGYSWDNPTIKCHNECIGGCVNETSSGCSVCRNFRLLNNTCVRECPADLFVLSKLCVDAKFCRSQQKIAFNRECLHDCPKNYNLNNDTSASAPQCIECEPKCLKSCAPKEVHSLGESEEYYGCQVVQGDLYIRIHHGVADTTQRLERNMGDIEEIYGILRIYRSPALTSLSFLRNLRIIHGNRTTNEKYTVIIVENKNLERLWDFNEKKDLELKQGNMLVHFNSKLCLKDIYALQSMLKTNVSQDWISIESNGYEEICSARLIQANFEVLTQNTVTITIERIHVSEDEKIIGYLIYYMVAPERNVTHLGIETCSRFGWESQFIQNFSTESNVNYYAANITNLIQNTQYAFYVKIQVVPKNEGNALNVSQGQSKIKYFKTKYSIPTYPKVETYSKTSNTITLNWFPIATEPEKVDYYKVDIYRQPDDHSFINARNYCDEPRHDVHISHGIETASETMTPGCAAEFEEWRHSHYDSQDLESEWQSYRKTICSGGDSMNIDQRTELMKFLGNAKSNENSDSLRFKREIHDFVNADQNGSAKINNPQLDEHYVKTLIFENSQFKATITNLLPFSTYIFLFFSCNDISCSTYEFHFERTNSAKEADIISKLKVSIDSYDSHRVYVDFDEPKTPNGLTVAFNIEKYDWTNINTTIDCLTRKQHFDNGKRFTYSYLPKGQYSFRVQPISLAAHGPYTDHIYIHIVEKPSTFRRVVTYFVCSLVALSLLASIATSYRYFTKRYRIVNLSASRANMLLQMGDTSYTNTPVNELDLSFNHAHIDRESF